MQYFHSEPVGENKRAIMKKSAIHAAVLVVFMVSQSTAQIWQKVEDVGTNPYCIGVNPQNKRSVWFGGHSTRLYVSYDGGKRASRIIRVNLRSIPTDTPYFSNIFIHPRDTAFVMAAGTGCYKSNDDGKTWAHALPDTMLVLVGESITYEPSHPNLLYVGATTNVLNPDCLFFRSFDRGKTWNATLVPALMLKEGFWSMAAGGDGVLLAGTFKSPIWRSADYGETWNSVYVPADTLAAVLSIAFDRSNSNIVWATLGSGNIAKSSDRGLTWTPLAIPGNASAIETDGLGRIFVGLFGEKAPSVLMSSDGGKTWQHLSRGLASIYEISHAKMLKSDGGSPGLYLVDTYIGAYKLDNLSTRIFSPLRQLPHHFTLFQNHPNPFGRLPFNPTTTIRYSLSSTQRVRLRVFDIFGREVTTLVNKLQAAGDYAIDFDASQLAKSGVYFYQLYAGALSQTRKMVFTQ